MPLQEEHDRIGKEYRTCADCGSRNKFAGFGANSVWVDAVKPPPCPHCGSAMLRRENPDRRRDYPKARSTAYRICSRKSCSLQRDECPECFWPLDLIATDTTTGASDGGGSVLPITAATPYIKCSNTKACTFQKLARDYDPD